MAKTPSTLLVDSSPLVSADSQVAEANTVTRTPEQWAEILYPASDKGRQHPELWKHAAAAQLHAWGAYVARTGKTVTLTAADYEKALEAASSNDLTPHSEADYRTRS